MDDISIKMQALWKKMRLRFVNADSIVRLIYINIALFLLMRLLTVTSDLLGQLHYYTFYLSLPSSFSVLLTRPWTLFTYFFIHNDFMHLAMNMLCLYWFGSLFSRFFTSQQLVATYILGGIAGGVVYITAYHLFPFLSYGFLVGASASILSLLIAVAYRAPYYRLHLLLIGEVSLKTVAFVWVILDLLSITQENAGTHWAHFGGIAYGFFFAYLLHKGTDITAYPQMIWHNLKTLFGKKKKSTRVKANYQDVRFESDGDYNARKAREKQEIDLILDKIKRSGYSALSEEEKRKLFEAGNRP